MPADAPQTSDTSTTNTTDSSPSELTTSFFQNFKVSEEVAKVLERARVLATLKEREVV